MMSAVVYDVGYDTRLIKTRKKMVTVRLLAAIKEKQLRKTKIAHKISRFRSTLPYLCSEYRNLRHTIPLTIISDHGIAIRPFLESSLSFYI